MSQNGNDFWQEQAPDAAGTRFLALCAEMISFDSDECFRDTG